MRAPLCTSLFVLLTSLQHKKKVHNHRHTISTLCLKEYWKSVDNIAQASKLGILFINHLAFITHCYVEHTHAHTHSHTHTYQIWLNSSLNHWMKNSLKICEYFPQCREGTFICYTIFSPGLCGLGRETENINAILNIL